jgi:hypothetical protein
MTDAPSALVAVSIMDSPLLLVNRCVYPASSGVDERMGTLPHLPDRDLCKEDLRKPVLGRQGSVFRIDLIAWRGRRRNPGARRQTG